MPAIRRSPEPHLTYAVDVVLLTPLERRLAVLLRRTEEARERWALPWDRPRGASESLVESAQRIARKSSGFTPGWLEQTGAFSIGRHPSASRLSVAFTGLIPGAPSGQVGGEFAWFPIAEVPQMAPRQREILEQAVRSVQSQLDHAPIAFRLLPATFTLTALQQMYELLLGKRLHKASFRRALQAALLVEPTDEWRSEGRGRPAQLFRYAPRKPRSVRRGLRFDFVTG